MASAVTPEHVGYLAGLSVSLLWTFASLVFTTASRRVGPTVVNATRIAAALLLHTATHRLITGHWIPEARSQQVLCLAASGVLGLTIGDQMIFNAFLAIGPRLALLVMTTAPLLAAGLGAVFLHELLPLKAWSGIFLTLGGVAFVILERSDPNAAAKERSVLWRGCAYALIAATCQAAGLMLSKQGMGHGWLPRDEHMAPQTATLIRMSFAAVGIAPILAFRVRNSRRHEATAPMPIRTPAATPADPAPATTRSSLKTGLLLACLGGVLGPYLGVWMSLLASDRVPIGVAQTLLSLPPVLILPVARLVFGERFTLRAAIGAVTAVTGVALLALSES